jgi:hypothetical protein
MREWQTSVTLPSVAALAEVTMFILEGRSGGVLAALATAAAVALVSNIWDGVGASATPERETRQTTPATAVDASARPIAVAASEVRRLDPNLGFGRDR